MVKTFQSIFLLGLLFAYACDSQFTHGRLRVNALTDGQFELYRMDGDPASQFISEKMGKFNEDLNLPPGSYLVLTDCSHEKVLIKPGQLQALTVHRVTFKPGHAPQNNDDFLVQCSRFEPLQFRQNLKNRFEFDILSGQRQLLVGMKPLTLDLPHAAQGQQPTMVEIALSALQVTNLDPQFTLDKVPYFITPVDSLISVTQPQKFGHWQFLLPGHYDVEVHGTHKLIELIPGESLLIESGTIRLNAPAGLAFDAATRILGSPISALINENHLLVYNETIPALPGPVKIQLSNSHKVLDLEVQANGLAQVNMRSATIELGCSPWEWTCLGSQAVQVFDGDQHYPYIETVTDVPILFPEADVSIGLLTSAGLRYKIPQGAEHTLLKAGRIKLIPRPQHRPGQITDLVRIESNNAFISGHSRDIPPSGSSTLLLIAGEYRLAQYHSNPGTEGERWLKTTDFSAKPGETVEIEYPVYVSERMLKKILATTNSTERNAGTAHSDLPHKAKAARIF